MKITAIIALALACAAVAVEAGEFLIPSLVVEETWPAFNNDGRKLTQTFSAPTPVAFGRFRGQGAGGQSARAKFIAAFKAKKAAAAAAAAAASAAASGDNESAGAAATSAAAAASAAAQQNAAVATAAATGSSASSLAAQQAAGNALVLSAEQAAAASVTQADAANSNDSLVNAADAAAAADTTVSDEPLPALSAAVAGNSAATAATAAGNANSDGLQAARQAVVAGLKSMKSTLDTLATANAGANAAVDTQISQGRIGLGKAAAGVRFIAAQVAKGAQPSAKAQQFVGEGLTQAKTASDQLTTLTANNAALSTDAAAFATAVEGTITAGQEVVADTAAA
ncbi:hypothetical protein BDK51DRAFT_51364 [Blyttiomyces helicus]|uniref:Uncharacterized protein n=1 Tax=Blyttiomyces helicus TaxID=388810 RepID=A0A4P9W6S3_9FUNG|nr:hypothetical protein BDK51DRAFT_51364 [Blyttiomyces helicus]|eukprot:RKO87712.1 hypothetical protein BDK51DRAFT_51364 [Blyttiomyces helicus]